MNQRKKASQTKYLLTKSSERKKLCRLLGNIVSLFCSQKTKNKLKITINSQLKLTQFQFFLKQKPRKTTSIELGNIVEKEGRMIFYTYI